MRWRFWLFQREVLLDAKATNKSYSKRRSLRSPSKARKKEKKPGQRLAAYQDKRDFSRTKEPKPKIGKGSGWQFIVQKHDARRLHFDLRLELDGVLKSWAVTRGPSLVPGEKRLAVQTEDHPMEYLEWEGVIPKGEYGGGTIIVWDRGSWTPDGDAQKGLKKGSLDFILEGSRLKGRWHLVRMRRKSGDKHDPWLLIKSKDEHARCAGDSEIVDEEMTSALSGRTNAQLEATGTIRADHAARAKLKKAPMPNPARVTGAKKTILPPFIGPCFATRAERAPTGKNWIHEIKYDGYRMQARIDGGNVKLLTRTGLDWTHRFKAIEKALKRLQVGSALLDGEIVVLEESGISSFSGLQGDLKAGKSDRMAYVVFDILYLEGIDLRGAVLVDRKDLLRAVLTSEPEGSVIRFSDHMDGAGPTIFAHACRMGLEGLVSKRADVPYRSGRGEDWIKSKCVHSQEFVIIGFLPSTTLKNAIGSLVLGYYDNGNLVHVGRAGTGFSEELAVSLRTTLETRTAEKPNFKAKLPAGSDKGVRWVTPDLVAEVEYRGWTNDALLRQAAFKGLREDKAATDIRLEEKIVATTSDGSVSQFRLTHPERILWADVGITKQGLADFYIAIATWILPHVTGRVLSLVRCPSGVSKDCFYAKHAWKGGSSAMRLVDVGEDEPMLAIDDLEGLIALVQSGVLEIHPWGSRVASLEKPDRITIDLDPGPDVTWQSVIDAAFDVRQRLQNAKLHSFVKTTGGKGLHVVVPLLPEASWESVKAFTEQFAQRMAADQPKLYVAKMAKASRHGRIFVDYHRNGRGATAVAAYSTRARPGAAVSTPLAWEELSVAVGPAHFTIENLPQRLDYLDEDPWAQMRELKQQLPVEA
jgi:bifunctional non-homologous end joining protein LigD